MMGGEASKTCWATHKCQVINLWNCCILLVDLFELNYCSLRNSHHMGVWVNHWLATEWHGTPVLSMLITASYFRVCGVLHLFKISRKGPSNSKYKYCTYKSTERCHHIRQSMEKISVEMHLQILYGGQMEKQTACSRIS